MSTSTTVDRYTLTRRVMEDGGLDRPRDALRAIRATTAALGECLDEEGRDALASALPRPLAALVRRIGAAREAGSSDPRELYDRVCAREKVNLGFAREHAQAVCRVLGELLPTGAKSVLADELPAGVRELLEGRDEGAPPPHPTAHGPRHHTLATGRSGSAHPISDSAPRRAHEHSVAKNADPHGETKLSGAHGLTQEDVGDSLATAHPDERRWISGSKD